MDLKVSYPEEHGRFVAHDKRYFFYGNYETKSSKLVYENEKC